MGKVMVNKIVLMCVLCVIAGCEGDKQGCLALPAPPQVFVVVNDALTGAQLFDAQVKVNLVGNAPAQTINAAYVANIGGGGGIYKALPDSGNTNNMVNIVVAAKGYYGYQSNNSPLRNDARCGAENISRFTVSLCPEQAVCE
jgi:hypothetical protein